MPRGDNPNSRANLKQISPKDAREMQKKSVESRKYKASFRAAGKDLLTDEEMAKMWKAMIARAKSGNIAAFKMLFDVMGEGVLQETTGGAKVNLVIQETLPREEPPDE